MAYPDIWQPYELAGVPLRNRVFVSAHTTNFGLADDNHVTQRLVDYWRARAAAGIGLGITEGLRVHPTSLRRYGLEIFTDAAVPGLTRLTDAMHAEGARMFAQLLHTGRHVAHERQGAWGASALPWGVGEVVPHVLTTAELRTLADDYAAAARRAAQAGFDGIEVHLGHGHLLHQFLSPLTNTRQDGYGGTLDNRLRLAHEVLAAVIERAGGLPVGIRISADEFTPGGLDPQAMVTVVRSLLNRHELSFLHVSQAAYAASESLSTQIPDMHVGSAPYRELPRLFKESFPDSAVLAICRIDDTDVANSILQDGAADLVGMTRAHIADPRLLAKVVAGRRDTVRSCTASNQGCLARVERGLPMSCVVNPEVGLEREWRSVPSVPVRNRGRVLVVGAGPAGLEAAVTAARRGHAVTLAERSDAPGGTTSLAATMWGRERQRLLVDELVRDGKRAGVQLMTGVDVTPDWVREHDAQYVVVATGADHVADLLSDQTACWTVPQAMANQDALGTHVAIVDELGDWSAAGLAQHLAHHGRTVHLVSPVAGVAWNISVYSRVALLPRLARLGVQFRPLRRPVQLDRSVLTLQDPLTGAIEPVEPVTTVVHARPPAARTALYDALAADGPAVELFLIGDSYAPRSTLEAVYEGRLVGSAVGLDDRSSLERLHLRPSTTPSNTRQGELA